MLVNSLESTWIAFAGKFSSASCWIMENRMETTTIMGYFGVLLWMEEILHHLHNRHLL